MSGDQHHRPNWHFTALVMVAAVVPYIGALACGFVYDDEPAILNNPLVTGDFSPLSIFTSGFWGGQAGDNIGSYRPLTVLTFAIDHGLGGGSAFVFHLSNLVFHALAAGAAFLVIAKRFGRKDLALIATLLFSVHAVHTENIAGLVGRADVLATIFLLVAWHGSRQGHIAWRVGSVFALLAGLLCKEVAVAALGLVVAELVLRTDPEAKASRRQRMWVAVSMAVAVGVYLAMRIHALGALTSEINLQSNPLADATLGQRLLTAFYVTARAVSLLALPIELSADYSFAEIMPISSPWDPQVLGGALLWLLVPVLILYYRRRKPPVAVGLAFAIIAYAPVSNLFFLVPTIFGERLLYTASLGLAIAVAFPLSEALSGPKRKTIIAAVAALALCHSARSAVYTWDWRSMETLFATAAKVSPKSARVWLNRGVAALDDSQPADAIGHFERALTIAPRYGTAFTYIGIALDQLERPAEAHRALRRGFELYPQGNGGAKNLVKFYIKYGRWAQAGETIDRFSTAGGNTTVADELRKLVAHAQTQVRPRQQRNQSP